MTSPLPTLSLINGVVAQSIPISDRGLAYGDGLFETILCLKNTLVLQHEHLARLQRDAARLGITMNQSALMHELSTLQHQIAASGHTAGVVKIIITRTSAARGYATGLVCGSNRVLQFIPGIQYPKANRDGIRITLSDVRLAQQPLLAGIKHLNRLEQVLAHSAIAKPYYQEALVCDAQQYVIEGTISNVFLAKAGKLYTPLLDQAGVRGVMRDYLLDTIVPQLKLEAYVQRLTLADVLSAEEVFVCNSVFGVWPVTALNVREFPAGAVTCSIQQAVDAHGYPEVHG